MSVKPKYKVKVDRCYRIVITDETDKEVWDDFWFGSKDGAVSIGDNALKRINEGTLPCVKEGDLLLDEFRGIKPQEDKLINDSTNLPKNTIYVASDRRNGGDAPVCVPLSWNEKGTSPCSS